VIVSYSRQFVFVHIHKTAGESITATLRPVLAPDDLLLRGTETVSANGIRLNKHSTAGEVRNVLPSEEWDRYFTFGFVRHPIERTVSLYRWAAQRSRPPRLTAAQRIGFRPAPPNPDRSGNPEIRAYRETNSISEFIRHPLMEETRSMKPQSTSLCDEEGHLLVDYVGRFERLSQSFAHIEKALGLSSLSLKWQNASQGPQLQFERKNGRRYGRADHTELTSDDVAHLTNRFEDDFRLFDYEL
jgi:hypothetical protein